jgi:hypothetical protein
MREICTSGSEGGGGLSRSLPLSNEHERRATGAPPAMNFLRRLVGFLRDQPLVLGVGDLALQPHLVAL